MIKLNTHYTVVQLESDLKNAILKTKAINKKSMLNQESGAENEQENDSNHMHETLEEMLNV